MKVKYSARLKEMYMKRPIKLQSCGKVANICNRRIYSHIAFYAKVAIVAYIHRYKKLIILYKNCIFTDRLPKTCNFATLGDNQTVVCNFGRNRVATMQLSHFLTLPSPHETTPLLDRNSLSHSADIRQACNRPKDVHPP